MFHVRARGPHAAIASALHIANTTAKVEDGMVYLGPGVIELTDPRQCAVFWGDIDVNPWQQFLYYACSLVPALFEQFSTDFLDEGEYASDYSYLCGVRRRSNSPPPSIVLSDGKTRGHAAFCSQLDRANPLNGLILPWMQGMAAFLPAMEKLRPTENPTRRVDSLFFMSPSWEMPHSQLLSHIEIARQARPPSHMSDPFRAFTSSYFFEIDENPEVLLSDLDAALQFGSDTPVGISSRFVRKVAVPMIQSWHAYRNMDFQRAESILSGCKDMQWRLACNEYIERRRKDARKD